MSGRPGERRALWLTAEAPDRRLGGGNIRQAHLVGALGARMPTDVLLAGHLEDPVTAAAVRRVIEVPNTAAARPTSRTVRRAQDLWLAVGVREPAEVYHGRINRRALASALADLGSYDIAVVNHQALMPLLLEGRAHGGGRWVAHLHNVAAERARQAAAAEPGGRQRWLLHREAAKADRFERWTVQNYDAVLVCSDEDATMLAGADRSRARGPVIVTPSGVDTEHFRPSPLATEPRLVVTATLNYWPNVDGLLWFARDVMPRIARRVPDVKLDIVGRTPVADVAALADGARIAVHADVPDVAPFLYGARVAVVPLRMGTGTRLKALEALAAGRPLVGTSIGLAGLRLADGRDARYADSPEAMADAIVELLRSDAAAENLAAAGRERVERDYQWPALGDAMVDQLFNLIDN